MRIIVLLCSMDPMTTTALEIERPKFDRSDISPFYRLMAEEIGDLNENAFDTLCSGCQTPLSWYQWINGNDYRKETACHSCGKRIYSTGSYEWTMPVEQEKAVATPGYFNRRWYHATRRENWAEVVQEAADGKLLIHAGSKLAALSRADLHFRDDSKRGPVFLYSFEFLSTSAFSITVYDDMGEDWPGRLGDHCDLRICRSTATDEDEPSRWGFMGKDVLGIPYYNRYEVPGEISILFSAALIDLSTVKVVDLSPSDEPTHGAD